MNYVYILLVSGIVLTSSPVASSAGEEDLEMNRNVDVWIKSKQHDFLGKYIDDTYVNLKKSHDVGDLNVLVSIGNALMVVPDKSEIEYRTFFGIMENVLNYEEGDSVNRTQTYTAQAQLAEILLTEINKGNALSVKDQQNANYLLSKFIKQIDDRIIPDYQPRKVYLNVPPPTNNTSTVRRGFNVTSVEDKALREEWELAIEKNRQNSRMNKEQRVLLYIKQVYGPRVFAYLSCQPRIKKEGDSGIETSLLYSADNSDPSNATLVEAAKKDDAVVKVFPALSVASPHNSIIQKPEAETNEVPVITNRLLAEAPQSKTAEKTTNPWKFLLPILGVLLVGIALFSRCRK